MSFGVANNIFWEGDEEGCFALLSTCSSNSLQGMKGKESCSANSCCSCGDVRCKSVGEVESPHSVLERHKSSSLPPPC